MKRNEDRLKLENQETLSWSYFIESIGPAATKETYTFALLNYIKTMGYDLSNTDTLLEQDHKKTEYNVFRYFSSLNKKGNLSPATLRCRFAAIKQFYTIQPQGFTDVNWERIRKNYVNKSDIRASPDEPYTYEQISKLLNIADIRMKVCIYLMCGAGVRIGAIPTLKYKDIKEIKYENYNLVQLTVYGETNDQYTTFGTPELLAAIQNYIQYRKRYGEELKPNSPLVREQFDISDIEAAKNAKSIAHATIKTHIHKLLYRSGIRKKENIVTKKGERHTNGDGVINSLSHGLRKFYRTQLFNAEIDPLIAEILTGHDTGLIGVYTKPTLRQQLEQFTKAISRLTINEEERQKVTIERLEAESEKQKTTFLKALEDRDSRFNRLAAQIEQLNKKLGI